VTKLGRAEYAGKRCEQALPEDKTCRKYARVVVGIDKSIVYDRLACQAHAMNAVRAVWRETDEGAVVREIPGMWRDPRD